MTLQDAATNLWLAGHDVLWCHNKRVSANGSADQLAISSKPGFVLINFQVGVDYFALHGLIPEINDLPRVKTPSGGFHLHYRGDTQKPQILATNRDGSPRITVCEYAVTFPTPGYILENGSLTDIPRRNLRFWQQLKIVCGLQTVRQETIVPLPSPLPSKIPDLESYAPIVRPLPSPANVSDYETMAVTEDNAAVMFENNYGENLRYCDAWDRWLEWDSSRWKLEQTLKAFDYARLTSRTFATVSQVSNASPMSPAKAGFSRGVEAFCRASRVFATEAAKWDRDTMLLNTPGGTVDLRTGELRPHRKDDHITKQTNVTPAEGNLGPWITFLRDVTNQDDSLAEYLQRALGACLSGAIQDNFLLFFYGTGQNGKSVLGELIGWMLGDYAIKMVSETLMDTRGHNQQHLTFLMDLRGARLAITSEVAEGSYFDEQRIKQLTGDEIIKANRMHQDPVEFPRTSKILMLGNHRPLLRIVDPAIRSRLHIVPFKAYFPPETRNPLIRKQLEEEAPAILNWLIQGHVRWLEQGYLKKSHAVQDETDQYFDSQSTNENWAEECCVVGEDRTSQANELYRSFKAWKEARGEGVPSQTRFSEWLGVRWVKRKAEGVVMYDGVAIRPAAAPVLRSGGRYNDSRYGDA